MTEPIDAKPNPPFKAGDPAAPTPLPDKDADEFQSRGGPSGQDTNATPDPMAARDDPESDPDEHLGDDEERELRQQASTINNVWMQAKTALFGTTGVGHKPTVGTIRVAEILTNLTAFCGCDAFEQAEKVLHNHGMVVLLGGEGTGRYLAGIALLGDWPEPAARNISSLSPTTVIADLANPKSLKAGRRYLLHDMRGDGRTNAVQRFELTRLRQTLTRSGIRLVVTADPTALARSDFGDLVVDWEPPSSMVLFEQYLACSDLSLSEDDLARAAEHAGGLRRPGEVAAFVARLANGVEAAVHSQSEVDRQQVRNWFDDQSRGPLDELAVAAACFLNRAPERMFERWLSRLQELVREHDPREFAPLRERPTLLRSRQAWAGADGLLATIDSDDPFGERMVAFRSPHMRLHAIAEIWNRYGDTLLEPLRQLIRELIGDRSIEIRIDASLGLALLAERRWPEVKESFLEPWSRGSALERSAAANTLSMLAASDRLSPLALELALGWCDNSGVRPAMTAALALAGPLSSRYPDQAFEQLWYLTTRGAKITAVARATLKLMFASADDDERAMRILRTTESALAWTLRRPNALKHRGARSTVLSILSAQGLSSDELMIGQLVYADPAAPEVIGALLAAVLQSGPHHHEGAELLRQLLRRIELAENPTVTAGRLGATLFCHWSAEEEQILRPKLESALRTCAADAEVTHNVIRSFLHSIDSRH